MGSKVGRPPDVDSTETRQKILQAARVRFARDGYRSTTNRRIADDVGITPGAIYHYVDSKAALYADVFNYTVDEAYTELERVAATETTLFGQVGAVLRRSAEMQFEDPSIAGFIVAVAQETQRHPDLLALLEPQRRRHAQFFADLVAQASERGELAVGVDRRALADLLAAVMSGLARIASASGEPGRYAAAADVLDQFVDGTLLVPTNRA